MRWKRIEQHHDRCFALRLPLDENEFITTATHPLHIANSQICELNRVAAHLSNEMR